MNLFVEFVLLFFALGLGLPSCEQKKHTYCVEIFVYVNLCDLIYAYLSLSLYIYREREPSYGIQAFVSV